MALTLGNGIAVEAVGEKLITVLEHGKKWKISRAISIQEVLLRSDEEGRKVEFTFEVEVTKERKNLFGLSFLPFGSANYQVNFLNSSSLRKLREEMGWVDMGSEMTFSVTMPEIINGTIAEALRQLGEISD